VVEQGATFSGDSANLTLDVRARRVFLRAAEGRRRRAHLTPHLRGTNQTLRFFGGAWAFLQGLGVTGSMTIILTGTAEAEPTSAFAIALRLMPATESRSGREPVDEVLGEQIARLKKLIDTGSAEYLLRRKNSELAGRLRDPQST